MIWHNTDSVFVLKELDVDPNKGLLSGVADERLSIFGKNRTGSKDKIKFVNCFLSALNNKLYYFLAAISLLSLLLGFFYDNVGIFEPVLIIAILILNSLITGFYKYRSIVAEEKLNDAVNPNVTVLRDGLEKQISSELLVPGDILLLSEGDYITADARLISSDNFRTNEVAVTGESFPVEKRAAVLYEDITPVFKRGNMVFAGSSVVSGTAKAVVTDTGRNTELGKTNSLAEQSGGGELPINSSLISAEKIINSIIIVLCCAAFVIGILRNLHTSVPFAQLTVTMLSNTLALAVAAIPESLPAIAVIVVALGIERIVHDRIIIKKSKVLELLGKTNVICADKTGILTKSEMELTDVFDGDRTVVLGENSINEKDILTIRLAALCSTLQNDATEQAIDAASLKYCNADRLTLEKMCPRLTVIPFDTTRKTMTTVNMINSRPLAVVKGAPESVIPNCLNCNTDKIRAKWAEMSEKGLRVLCIAIKELDEIPANPSPENIETNLTFVALLGLNDPPRSGAVEGIRVCTKAGIRTVMMTGDSLATAVAVAKQIGILTDNSEAVTGAELDELTDEELKSKVADYSVYARITPAHKLRVISAWQSRGQLVTVTGDNTEDADALNAADVGCVMGTKGTDVARGTADMVIEENNFRYLVHAIEESRGLFENIKKAIYYLLGCNFSEILIYIICLSIFGFPPLAAVLLLWINLLTDCAPAISLATERSERSVMKQKPITLNGKLFDFHSIISIAAYAVFLTVTGILSFIIGNSVSQTCAVTMTFATVSMSQIFHSYNIKSNKSILKTDFKSNPFMNYSSAVVLFISMFLVLTPAGFVFGLTILSAGKFFTALALSLAIIPFGELLKWLLPKLKI